MKCNEKTAKFFIGEKLNEEVELGVSKLPPDIQVVYLAEGPLKAYKSHNTERNGQGLTKLVEWVEEEKKIYIQLIKLQKDGQQIANSLTGTGLQIADFRGIVSRIYTVSKTNQVSGIAVVRFGFIADGDEILNNIPIPEKDFRAITYDEKEFNLEISNIIFSYLVPG
ncbi:MAG: hypothetical protein EZS28_002048 [Streblomastix strix]|uniref:Uncharacterized protein n=1 Tax=Streblomastix strix TaxID=222440 RepID=A0A5J4X5D4_9EUKA|nr:MAG: hypothetical protein EZS28_002048 [Streblomastix strix]